MSSFKQSYNVVSDCKGTGSGGEENIEVVSSGWVKLRRLPKGSRFGQVLKKIRAIDK